MPDTSARTVLKTTSRRFPKFDCPRLVQDLYHASESEYQAVK